mgnify:CR=1 FL=1
MTESRIYTAALIIIGDEILSGRTQDKNVSQIALWLNIQGIRLKEVRVVADDMDAIIEAVNLFRAKIIDVSTESLTVEATGTKEKLDALMRVLEPFGIREMVQSGVVALSRGPRGMAVK